MDVKITPSKLCGKLTLPSSKSISHRALICAALSKGRSVIKNSLDCVDTEATIGALTALGAKITRNGENIIVDGIRSTEKNADINCFESGSTLRFILPIAAALGIKSTFSGKGKLPERPITPYFTELQKNGIIFTSTKMPYEINGRLQSGKYELSGDISSQFVTGLLFALPLLEGDSEIILNSPLQSKPYVDITIDCLKSFGIKVIELNSSYKIRGGQNYKACNYNVEADFSNAAFFLTANTLGSKVELLNLNATSKQGDAEIQRITTNYNGSFSDIDVSQIPDLVPILTVLAALSKGSSKIYNAARLRLKECDRLSALSTELNRLGAEITETEDSLEINGVASLHGGTCDSHNDHRIAMSLAIAALKATEPIVIKNAECVSKSYPEFWDDYKALGGIVDVINA